MQENKDLIEFMKLYFKEDWSKVLEEELSKLKISKIDDADSEAKRLFIENVLGKLVLSPQRKEFLLSQLRKILKIATISEKSNFIKFKEKEEEKENPLNRPTPKLKQELDNHIDNHVQKTKPKLDSIMQIFWTNAISAEKNNIKKDSVHKVIKDSIKPLKKNIFDAVEQFHKNIGISTELVKRIEKINTANMFDKITSQEHEKEKEVAKMVRDTKKDLDNNFIKFQEKFSESINKLMDAESEIVKLNDKSKESVIKALEDIKNKFDDVSTKPKN